ncbi:FtsX-like permease family protein [Streptomyces boncukensis]|uniref:FtsX-like permease family protein n=1 Tax=Streptomyces boncukensis TaxID=2711219 RepID=A0A6G4X4C2_9ACTN|nr:FtsX-like permease family protein [Streptomyces boncukensis]NGO72389.1 FtsX-like permease family protein [Streptomyces boncukensis]
MMLRYALRTVRARLGGFLGAFVALCCAAALITACGGLLETGLRGKAATERYGAAPLLVAADQNVHQTVVKRKKGKAKVKHKAKPLAERAWLPAGTLRTVRGTPGVARAVPELTFPARPVGAAAPDGASYGHAWSSAALTPFRLVRGGAPGASGDVVVDRTTAERARLTPGDRLTVQSTRAPRTYHVSGVAEPRGGELRHQRTLFFSAAEARRLAGRPGEVTAIGVVPERGTSPDRLSAALRTALGEGPGAPRVAGGDGRGPVEFPEAAGARTKLVSMGGAIGGTALLVAVLVVVGTFALAIQQRYREVALLRAIAATPRQIRRLLGREALLVGLAAGALGALLGLPLGGWLHGRFVATGAIPATLERTAGVLPPAAALGATLLGAWAAARVAARRISRIRPAEALAEAAVGRARPARGRILAGLALLAGGAALVAVLSTLRTEPAATPVTFLAVVVLAAAVSLLGPLLVRGAAALLARPLRCAAGAQGKLAAANLRGNAARMAAVVTPLTLLIGMTCTVLFVQPTLGDAARAQVREGTRADWVLTSRGPGVPAEAAELARTRGGAEATTEVVRTTVRVGLDKYPAQGVSVRGLTRTWDPGVTSGTLRGFGPRSAAVSERAADRLGLRPGSPLKLTLGDGPPVRLTVAAVYARGLGFGDLTLPHALVSRHVDNPLAEAVLVTGGRRADLASAVRSVPGVEVRDRSAADRLQAAQQQENAEVNYLAMGLVLAFTAIAVVNTLAMTLTERVREFALLRLAGATRGQVLRMLLLEALAVLLTAALAGSGIALAVLSAFSAGMTGSVAPAAAPTGYAAVLAAAALLALVGTGVPGRAALRERPVSAAVQGP